MTTMVIDHLPLVSLAPNGVKRLRALILQLAVMGRLVPQDPGDEPAQALLTRMRADRERLVKEGAIKREKPLPEIEEHEKPHDIPRTWAYVRLGELGDWGAGATPLRNNSLFYNGTIPWFKSGELKGDFISESEEKITELALRKCSLRQNESGDVLIAMYGATIGKTAILAVPATTNQAVCACTPLEGLTNRFLLLVLKALKPALVRQGAGGAQPNISREKIVATIIGLPPAAEQHRIVAKVDKLMALCDQLEAQHNDAESAHTRLVRALLETLVQSRDPSDFATSWERIKQNFDALFTTEASIDTLKQTLVQLAVMGKLVPQDSNDEPDAQLLERINAGNARLVKNGKVKQKMPSAHILQEKMPFKLPAGWEWVTFRQLVIHSEAGWSPNCEPRPRIGNEWGVLKVSAVSWGEFRSSENKALPMNLTPKIEYEVRQGDFLISRANTAELVAKSVVVGQCEPRLMLSDKIVRLNLSPMASRLYCNLFNNSFVARSYYQSIAGGTSSSMKNVSREQILSLLIALPPRTEQDRIVEILNKLTSMCDGLKDKLKSSSSLQELVAMTLIEQAVNGAESSESAKSPGELQMVT